MANADVFSEGFDAGIGKKTTKKKKKDSGNDWSKANPRYFKHGGRVKKTGMAKVHRGEFVLTAAQAKSLSSKKKSARKRIRSK